MDHRLTWDDALQLLSATSSLVLIARLAGSRLISRYPAFSTFLVGMFLRDTVLQFLPFNSDLYALSFMATAVISWVLFAATLRELYRQVFRKYLGLASVSGRIMLGALFVSLLVGITITAVEERGNSGPFPVLHYYRVGEEVVFVCLTIFLAFITSIFAWFPIVLNRNLKAYFIGFATYFILKVSALFYSALQGTQVSQAASNVIVAAWCISLWYWCWVISAKGEQEIEVSRFEWLGGNEEKLERQLIAINSFVSRTGRQA